MEFPTAVKAGEANALLQATVVGQTDHLCEGKHRPHTRVGWTRQPWTAAILGEEDTLSENLNHRSRMTSVNLAWGKNRMSQHLQSHGRATSDKAMWCRPAVPQQRWDGAGPSASKARGPNQATDCDSESPAVTGGEQSRAAGHPQLRILQWNAEGVRHKKTELHNFLKTNCINICCTQESHLNSSHGFSARGYETYR